MGMLKSTQNGPSSEKEEKGACRPSSVLALVPPPAAPKPAAGRALVLGPFPPLIGAASAHASALLHMFKSEGYEVRSATGPGLALARHAISFASETRLRKSAAFLKGCEGDDHAVVYARSFDFSKITKPRWYKRRLEELRRLRLLCRIVRGYRTTTLVLERRPFLSRYQLSLLLVAGACGLAFGKRVRAARQTEDVACIYRRISGTDAAVPTPHQAETTAYEVAFNDQSLLPRVRLTVARAEQSLNSWLEKHPQFAGSQAAQDIRELIEVTKRHEFGHLEQFKLLWATTDGRLDALAEASGAAAEFLDPASTFGVPVTRYMHHLWVTYGPERAFAPKSRKCVQKILAWYLFEAPAKVAGGAVPVCEVLRGYYLEMVGQARDVSFQQRSSSLAFTDGRDARPFPVPQALISALREDADLRARYDISDAVDRIALVLEALFTSSGDVELGPKAERYLTAPIGGNPANASRLEFLLAMQARGQLENRDDIEQPWRAASMCAASRGALPVIFPALKTLLRRGGGAGKTPPDLVVAGLPRSETGVGSNLHMSVAAFDRIGVVPKIFDSLDGMQQISREMTGRKSVKLGRPVSLHHVNADQIPQSILALRSRAAPDAHQIGFLLWEFDVLPDSHRLALDMLDEIWTPSSFLQEIYSASTSLPVHNMKKGLHIPEVPQFDFSRLGISKGTTVFLTCFDFHSSVARKNPLAAVKGFQDAFPAHRKDVALVVKTTPSVAAHWGDPERQMQQISQLARGDARIHVIAEYYPFNKLLSLIAGCSCLVSPHRAEGFGLMPAYALGFGRTVVSTDYSGTSDFCTGDTSFVIPFRLVSVDREKVLHPVPGATWAEIDRDALAQTLRAIADDPQIGRARALKGQELIRTVFSPGAQASRYRERLGELRALRTQVAS